MKTLTLITDDKAAAINGGTLRNVTNIKQVAKRGSNGAFLVQNTGSTGNALLAVGGVLVF
jgi:hypothetical protein